MLPILKYIKITKNTMDTFSLNFIEAIASLLVFFILFSSFFCFVSVAKDAPYPASAIFFIISFELVFLIFHLHGICQKIYRDILHTFKLTYHSLHFGGAGGTTHSGNIIFFFYHISPFFYTPTGY